MSYSQGTFKIKCGIHLFYQSWLPEKDQKANIVLVHGLAEHSGRYENLVRHLLPMELAVWAYDQRGHGRSPGARCYVDHFTDLTSDLGEFINLVRQRSSDAPMFILGHSMGALETVAFVSDCPERIDGVILSGLILKVGEKIPGISLALAKILSRLIPRFGVRRLNINAVSRDNTVVDNYISDPLVFTGMIPARMGDEILATMSSILLKLPSVSLPVLLLHGACDKLAAPSSSQLMFDSISSIDKQIHIFPGCYHEIFNEPCREYVLGITSGWIEKHLPSHARIKPF